jgi:very-short-patch-repair endonuclease
MIDHICEICKNKFETKRKTSRFCSIKCYHKLSINNPMFGKHHSEETKKIIGEKSHIRLSNPENHPMFGKKRPDTTKRNIENNPTKDIEVRKKIRLSSLGRLSFIKGKTWEEFYGLERAIKMKKEYSINNPAKRPEVRAKMSISNRNFLINNPEKHPNHIHRRDRKTKGESNLQGIIESLGMIEEKDFEYNKYLRTKTTYRFPDFRFKNIPLIIELNGFYTHFTPKGVKADISRKEELEEVGYNVMEFTLNDLKNPNKVRECILKKSNQLQK